MILNELYALDESSGYSLEGSFTRDLTTSKVWLLDELAKIKDFHGVTGKMSMNENRDAVKSAVVVQVQGNDYKFITSVNP